LNEDVKSRGRGREREKEKGKLRNPRRNRGSRKEKKDLFSRPKFPFSHRFKEGWDALDIKDQKPVRSFWRLLFLY